MKQLSGSSHGADWEKQIMTDLVFIKKHLRYPMHKNRLIPIIFWVMFFLLIGSIILSVFMTDHNSARKIPFSVVPGIIPIIIIARYVRSLKFVRVHTPFVLAENIKLVERFLKSQHMLIFRHPDAPEVFQIVSKNVSVGKEEREIMVFIADDNKILVNSHFTRSGWSISPVKSHTDTMCKRLLDFIKQETPPGTALKKTF